MSWKSQPLSLRRSRPEQTLDEDRFPEAPEAVAPPPRIQPTPLDPSKGPGVSPGAAPLPTVRVDPDLDSLRQVVIPPPPLEVRVPPSYPQSELRRGLQGGCVVQYDILANGRTANARTLACDSPGFARAAPTAVAQWRYAAAISAASDSVVQRGVHSRLDFALEG
jgi:TonB family protein